ncbi:MAG: hypothetical protein KJT03_23005, partial [Verrucomicrobiae bacterium]|nr:hypothetical protein [Verrucomicrobiae bacterium]
MVRSVGETPELLSLDEFPPHTYAEWKDAAEKLLKGAPFEKCLVAATDEGFSLQPLYRREDLASLLHLGSLPGEGNLHRGTQATTYKQTPWIVAQEAPWTDPETFNRGIRRDVEKGVNEICCQIGGSGGLNIQSLSDLEVALKDVDL